MTNYDPISVWGARTADPEEVFDAAYQELTEDDLDRRSERRTKDTMRRLKAGEMRMDDKKFSPAPRMVALYRADGTLAAVPHATYLHYLRKRDKDGNRVFYSQPPVEPPKATSDPCPCRGIEGRICGWRGFDQIELIKHMFKKHPDRAAFYLSQEQIDAAMGKISFNPSEGMSETGTAKPVSVNNLTEDMISVSTVEDKERERNQDLQRRRHREQVDEALVEVEEVKAVRTRQSTKKNPSIPHSCAMKGRLGNYDEDCPRCIELIAEKLEDETATLVSA